MISDYFKIALRSLSRRKLRSWLTMLGIFIGIAAVVSLIGLGEGLSVAISAQFGDLGTDVLSIQASGLNFAGPPGSGTPDPLTTDLTDKIAKVSNVDYAIDRHIESGTMSFNGRSEVGYAMNIPPGEKRKVVESVLNIEAEDGRLLKEGDKNKVVIGNNFKGDSIFGKSIKVGDRILLEDIQFKVVGILKKKGSFIFDNIILMEEEDLLEYLKDDDETVNIIAVKVKDENQIGKTKEDIEKLLRKERGVKIGEEDFEVQSPEAALDSLNSTLFAVQLFVYIIAGISLLVGGIGIMNTMYTAVLERTKEIGIMKSIGAKNSDIFSIFLFESGILGMLGGLIGIVLGLSLAYGLAAAGRAILGVDLIQAHVSIGIIIGALIFSFVLGTVFGVVPAYQASKLQPVESLRAVK